MIWRWIFGVCAGVIVLRVVANAWVTTFQARPVSTLFGTALVVAAVLVLAASLLADLSDDRRIELRRASEEYGPRVVTDPEDDGERHHVVHVVHHHHHHVEHVHRYVAGEATARREPGPVVDGELVVRRAIEGSAG